MKVRIEIECDNAAFDYGYWGAEVSRILRGVANAASEVSSAKSARRELDGRKLRDLNGNTVGSVSVEE